MTSSRPDKHYLQKLAKLYKENLYKIASLSDCNDKKVAAGLFNYSPNSNNSSQAKSMAFNDVIDSCGCERCKRISATDLLRTKAARCGALHAEIAALMGCVPGEPVTVCISTLEPCWNCTKALLARGVRYFLFFEPTTHSGKELWERNYAYEGIWELVSE